MIIKFYNYSLDQLNLNQIKTYFSYSTTLLSKLKTCGSRSRLIDYYLCKDNIIEVPLNELNQNELFATIMNIAQGYVIEYNFSNFFGIARTVLGEYFINNYSQTDNMLPYLLLSLFFPTRTQLLYVMMNYANTADPEDITNSLRSMLFTGKLFGVQKLALKTYLELEETGYLEKYSRNKTLITPTHFAYVFAKQLDKTIDFDTFRKILFYFSKKHRSELRYRFIFDDRTLYKYMVIEKLDDIEMDHEVFGILSKLEKEYGRLEQEIIKLLLI